MPLIRDLPLRTTTVAACLLLLVLSGSPNAAPAEHPLDALYRKVEGGAALQSAGPEIILRRMSLQLRGTIPLRAELIALRSTPPSSRQARFAVRFLRDPDFAHYWGTVLGGMFREHTRGRNEKYASFFRYLSGSLHSNRSYRSMVREMLTAVGDQEKNPAAGFYIRDDADPLQVAEFVGRVFYARRVGCARCHDHPYEKFSRRDYYGLAAFFSQQYVARTYDAEYERRLGMPPIPWNLRQRLTTSARKKFERRRRDWYRDVWRKMSRVQRREYRRRTRLKYRRILVHADLGLRFPHTDDAPGGDLVKPRHLDGTRPLLAKGKDRRQAFARWLTRKRNARFRKVIVNRVWTRLMGWSFFAPLDNWNDKTKVRAAPLLNHLAEVFHKRGYRIKDLILYIVSSRAYARRAARPGEKDAGNAVRFFKPVRLDPDQLMNSILRSAGRMTVTHIYERATVLRYDPESLRKVDLRGKGELKFPVQRKRGRKRQITNAAQIERPARYHTFLAVFGSGPRRDVVDDEKDATIEQVMTLLNGYLTGRAVWKFAGKGSQIAQVYRKKRKMSAVYQYIFETTLARSMTAAEQERLNRITSSRFGRRRSAFKRAAAQDVLWSVLNSREFLHVY